MTRATGGSALAATSTRSRLRAYAYSSASFVSLIPICSPSSPTSLTRGTRICSLIRSCWTTGRVLSSGRRRGLKGSSPSRVDPPHSLKRHCMQRRHSLVGSDSVEPRAALGRRGEGRCRSCFAEGERSRGYRASPATRRIPPSHGYRWTPASGDCRRSRRRARRATSSTPSPPRFRTAIASRDSRSPQTTMYGTFCSSASRIRLPSVSSRSSTSARTPAARSASTQLVRRRRDAPRATGTRAPARAPARAGNAPP